MITVCSVSRIKEIDIVWTSTESENSYYDVISISKINGFPLCEPGNYTNIIESSGNWDYISVCVYLMSKYSTEVQNLLLSAINEMMMNLSIYDEDEDIDYPDVTMDNIENHPLIKI